MEVSIVGRNPGLRRDFSDFTLSDRSAFAAPVTHTGVVSHAYFCTGVPSELELV